MTWVTSLKVLIIKTKNPNQNCWRVNLRYQRIQQNNKSKPKLKYIYIYIYNITCDERPIGDDKYEIHSDRR